MVVERKIWEQGEFFFKASKKNGAWKVKLWGKDFLERRVILRERNRAGKVKGEGFFFFFSRGFWTKNRE